MFVFVDFGIGWGQFVDSLLFVTVDFRGIQKIRFDLVVGGDHFMWRDELHVQFGFRVGVGTAWHAVELLVGENAVANVISHMDELYFIGRVIGFADSFEKLYQTHRQVKSFGLRVFNSVEKEPDELKDIKPVFFRSVYSLNGLELVFIEQTDNAGHFKLIDEPHVTLWLTQLNDLLQQALSFVALDLFLRQLLL